MRWAILAGALALLWAGPGAALTVYDEAVDGDLTLDPTDTFLGALPLGQSTVAGTTSAMPGSGANDGDAFSFDLAPSTRLVAAIVDADAPTGAPALDDIFAVLGPLGVSVPAAEISLPAVGAEPFAALLPLPPGSHRFRVVGWDFAGTEGEEQFADYAVTLEVARVPLPASAPLLLAAAAGLAALRRRR